MGYRSLGIGPGGPMDPFAYHVSNILAGNNNDPAVVEMHYPAPEILFLDDAFIAITGMGMVALINEVEQECWEPCFAKKDSILRFIKRGNGARAYLAVRNGWIGENWLGSNSTNSRIGIGGYQGRPIRKEDILEWNPGVQVNSPKNTNGNELLKSKRIVYREPPVLRCIHGPEWELMDMHSRELFQTSPFIVHSNSDRMGLRLTGPTLKKTDLGEMVSSPVDQGVIQLLPDGNLVILAADHQTTGGYPRAASVIRADWPILGQYSPLQEVSFKIVSLEEAEKLWIEQENLLQSVRELFRESIQ